MERIKITTIQEVQVPIITGPVLENSVVEVEKLQMMELVQVRDKPVLKALQNLMVLSEKVGAGAMAPPMEYAAGGFGETYGSATLAHGGDPVVVRVNGWVQLEVVQYPWKLTGDEAMLPFSQG